IRRSSQSDASAEIKWTCENEKENRFIIIRRGYFRRRPQAIETFDFVWSRIEAIIKDVLRNINNNVFDEIHTWVRASFGAIKSGHS
ncbi:LOW QUALITY PROTEIN: hypothetical protein RJ641_007919, partial [Dillenia turbinata]